jgi:AcrR family transcriptional regulator
MVPEQSRPSGLRADAERNRLRIIGSAQAAFAESGLDAPFDRIARDAGVGIATLYRRFPHRDDLIEACMEQRMDQYLVAVDDALARPDPWDGFCHFVVRACELQANDRGVNELLTRSFPGARHLEGRRRQTVARLDELIRRAQAAGRLRPDFVHEDVPLLLMANAGVVRALGDTAPDAWRRFVALMLDAFATRPSPGSALPRPPSPTQVVRAMVRATRAARSGRANTTV